MQPLLFQIISYAGTPKINCRNLSPSPSWPSGKESNTTLVPFAFLQRNGSCFSRADFLDRAYVDRGTQAEKYTGMRGREKQGLGGEEWTLKKCQYYAYKHTIMKIRLKKEQLLQLNKTLKEDAGKAKIETVQKKKQQQAGLRVAKPLKNGSHPLRKLTFLPSNTCTHSYRGMAKSRALKSTLACV